MNQIAMERLKTLIHDDDSAVSPVIGVILMVAITVILAAVIASFVLGLGDQTDDVSPNIQFDTEYENGTTINATVSIGTTDSDVDANNIYVRGDFTENSGNETWGDVNAEIAAGSAVTIGNSSVNDFNTTTDLSAGDEIQLVFETDSTSDTLDTFEVPDV